MAASGWKSTDLYKKGLSPLLAHGNGKLSLLRLLVLCSGLAGLGYQMSWTRMLSVSLGHEFIAVLAVVSAFFVGLALGGFGLNKIIRNTAQPLKLYVALELIIGFWALALIFLIPQFNLLLPKFIGSSPHIVWHCLLAFGASLLILLPATFAMGATLPAVERLADTQLKQLTGIAGIYSMNTFGAVLGTLISTYWLLPSLGLKSTLFVFAIVNISVAALSYLCFKQPAIKHVVLQAEIKNPLPSPNSRLLSALFITGFLGLGYEVLVIRVLAQVLEGTVYTFAAILSVYLVGTALGAAGYQRLINDRAWPFEKRGLHLCIAISCACTLGSFALWASGSSYHFVFSQVGSGLVAALFAELSVATLILIVPTFFMGALFSHLVCQCKSTAGIGTAFGINTLGAALAPMVFGIILLPALGAKTSLALVSLCYLPLLLVVAKPTLSWQPLLPLAAIGLFLGLPQKMQFIDKPANSRVLHYKAGVVASVAIVEEADKSRHLKVNNHFTMGGTASRFSDHRQTHLPMLLQGGAAKNALYLGLGTGVTFQAAQYYANLKATAVELIPELPPLMPEFGVDVNAAHWVNQPTVVTADARRFVVADKHVYDVIIAEVFHPSRDGAGSLYTVEHFQAVKNRLTSDGVFCQWLPLFQLELDVLKTIVRSYLQIFPNAQLHMAHHSLGQPLLCLLGGPGLKKPFYPGWLLRRVHYRPLQQQLVLNGLNSDFVLFGGFLANSQGLRRFSGQGALNVDDRPVVTYAAPNFVYRQANSPAERLLQLIEETSAYRRGLIEDTAANRPFIQQLQNYWRARDIYLAAGVGIQANLTIAEMYQRTGKKLFQAVAVSADFTAAYDSLLEMAQGIYRSDPTLCGQILLELQRLNPALPEAKKLHEQLFR